LKDKKKKGNKNILKNKAIDIYFFTGTGNTYIATKKIAEILETNGCTVGINDISRTNFKNVNLANTIGLGFPIACWNTFPIVRKFINDLPKTKGTEIFIFTTMGNSSLNAAANFGNKLKNKGYSLIGTAAFLMPNNFISVQEERENILKIKKAYKKMEIYAKDLANGTAEVSKTNLFFKTCFVISGFVINRLRGNLLQKIIKFTIIKDKCTKCGLCIKICPVENISFRDKYPVFNAKKCQLCLRCISYCPSYAIKSFLIKRIYRALSNEDVKNVFFKIS